MGKHKEKKSKKHKEKKIKLRKHSSSSKSSEEEWVEKPAPIISSETTSAPQRDAWMSLPTQFSSVSNIDKRQQRDIDKRVEKERVQYNPGLSSRELNPYWKGGGDGMPKFQKPCEDINKVYTPLVKESSTSNWRKTKSVDSKARADTTIESTDLNTLAAKLLKAEILGNTSLVAELKAKLEKARSVQSDTDRDVILTHTDSKGYSRPVKDYGEPSGTKRKKVETHNAGERVCYFPDDEKYTLKQMFEKEKYRSVEDSNKEFMKYAGKVGKNDDLDDFFTDKIRESKDDGTASRNKAIHEHRETMAALENCTNCLQSPKMLHHLIVSTKDNVYLSLPPHEPLTVGHCLLVPLRHTPCSTHLDENEWEELIAERKILTNLFAAKNEDVIFFETAMFLHRHPHMTLHCVPVPKEQGDLAPIYFKKAIDESEREWSSNKKLVSLAGRDVRRAIPKGLPYFAVSFGMDEGFAHVIEDQRLFPINFAQEIIGGILDLHHSKWRKPKLQKYEEQKQRVTDFCKEYDSFNS